MFLNFYDALLTLGIIITKGCLYFGYFEIKDPVAGNVTVFFGFA